jgi:hypothetical protein
MKLWVRNQVQVYEKLKLIIILIKTCDSLRVKMDFVFSMRFYLFEKIYFSK